jgi:hypothetical protein
MVRKLKYTGNRITKYQDALNKYADDKKKLNKRIENINALELEARNKNLIKQKNINVIADITFKNINTQLKFMEKVQAPLLDACQLLQNNEYYYLQISINGKDIILNKLIKAHGGDAQAIYFNSIYKEIVSYVDGEEKNLIMSNDKYRISIIKSDKIPIKKIQQSFRDGEAHCVIQPLYDYWMKISNNSESEASKKRCLQIANKIKKYEEIYPKGVPEDKMTEIAKAANRCLIIHDILGNVITKYNESSSKYFYFTNTRINHLEKGHLTVDKMNIKVTLNEINKIIKEHDDEKIFYLISKNADGNCTSLKSIKGDWHVINEEYDIYNEFNNKVGVNNYSIDAIKYEQLNNFIYESRIINSAPVALNNEPNNLDGVKHIDIEKAYTQHNKCDYFMGFLGHIQKFNKLPFDIDSVKFLKEHLGIFQFSVIENNNDLLIKLGIVKGNKYTLPAPEILYFIQEFNIKVKLISGCWGSKFNFEYTPEMLENRRYCIWAGKLSADYENNIYTFNCDNKEWVSYLKHQLGDNNVYYFEDKNNVIIKVPKKTNKTKHHILSFITSYTRINMLNIMKNIKGELVKVILDGIYFKGEIGDIDIPFKFKEVKKHLGFRDGWYTPSIFESMDLNPYNEELDGNCILSGQGGSGKSYSVLTDKGILNVLYVVPCHVLGKKCREKYGCNYTTINKLIGMECMSYKDEFKTPPVIFIDEATMIEKSWIEKAIEMYKDSLIYVAGDIDDKQWYQCRNGYPSNFSQVWHPKNWRYVNYTNDFRAKDEELKKMKLEVRKEMKKIFTDGGQIDSLKMSLFVKSKYKTVKFTDAVKMFQTGDVWIAGTHKTNELLLKNNVISGYINKNKEIVQQDEKGSEKRGSFTTHSLQGLTLENERIFISLDFFEYAMFYTSISRACNFKQIVIVN